VENTMNTSSTDCILGDTLEELRVMPSNSVDMVWADPPYNIGKRYGKNGSGADRLVSIEYKKWCGEWIHECWRILKNTGTFYLKTLDRHLEWKLPLMADQGVFINLIKWKNASASHSKRAYWSATEPIICYGKTDQYKFNTYGQTRKNLERWGEYKTGPKGQLMDLWDDIAPVFAGSIHHPEAIMQPGTNRKVHPTQMPTGLATRAIYMSTDECDLVFDPFMGIGTTGVACVRSGRHFIGVDRVAKYVDIARERIKDAKLQIRMAI
jgi:site-specific DNA-methyltransferase (adenine-specific)